MKSKVYSLKKEGKIYALAADGIVQVCPFQQPVPAKTAVGIQMMPAACSSQCPHFNPYPLIENGQTIPGKGLLHLHCTGEKRVIDIEHIEGDLKVN